MHNQSDTLHLSRTSDRPMYQQIIDQMKLRVAIGDWSPGREVRSIRGLAADIGVSVITVKRAYLELEREGVLETRRGKGTFVAEGAKDLHLDLQEQEIERRIDAVIEAGRALGWSDSKIKRALGDALRSSIERRA